MEQVNVKRALVRANGINLFYRDAGAGDSTILCLHGKWGRGETWTDFMNRYGDRYRILAPDQRGHGLSDKPVARYAGEDLAADAAAFIEELGCGPVIVVGHSMGGMVAGHLAARYPHAVKACVILDQGASGSEKMSTRLPEQIQAIDELTLEWPIPYPTYEQALTHLAQHYKYPSNTRYFLESLTETMAGYEFLFSSFAMAAINEYWHDWHDLLPKIECPVLLVRATESWNLSREEADKMRPLIKDCAYYEVTRSDHMIYVDNPDEFYPPFDKFLNSLKMKETGER